MPITCIYFAQAGKTSISLLIRFNDDCVVSSSPNNLSCKQYLTFTIGKTRIRFVKLISTCLLHENKMGNVTGKCISYNRAYHTIRRKNNTINLI